MKRCIVKEHGAPRPRVYWFLPLNNTNSYDEEYSSVTIFAADEGMYPVDVTAASNIIILNEDTPHYTTNERHSYLESDVFDNVVSNA